MSHALISEKTRHIEIYSTPCFLRNTNLPATIHSQLYLMQSGMLTHARLISWVITLTLLVLGFGWVGRVPLAFILLTSLLNADMSGSRGRAMTPAPPVRASSRCSAMKGVPLPWPCSCLVLGWGCSLWTFSPFKPLSTSSKDNTTPELATTEETRQNPVKSEPKRKMFQMLHQRTYCSLWDEPCLHLSWREGVWGQFWLYAAAPRCPPSPPSLPR